MFSFWNKANLSHVAGISSDVICMQSVTICRSEITLICKCRTSACCSALCMKRLTFSVCLSVCLVSLSLSILFSHSNGQFFQIFVSSPFLSHQRWKIFNEQNHCLQYSFCLCWLVLCFRKNNGRSFILLYDWPFFSEDVSAAVCWLGGSHGHCKCFCCI